MADLFRGLGKLIVGSWAAVAGFFGGLFGWPIALGVVSGLPLVPSLTGAVSLSVHVGAVTAAIAFGAVMLR